MCHLSLVACHLSPRTAILEDYQVSPSMAASLMALPSVNMCQILMLGFQGVVDLWINCTIHFVVCIYAQAQCLSFCCLTMTREPLAPQDLPRPWRQLTALMVRLPQQSTLLAMQLFYARYYLSSFLGYCCCRLAPGQEKGQLWDVSRRNHHKSYQVAAVVTDM